MGDKLQALRPAPIPTLEVDRETERSDRTERQNGATERSIHSRKEGAFNFKGHSTV